MFPLHRLGCCGRVSIHYFLTWPTFIHPFIAPANLSVHREPCVELPWLFLISLRIAVSRRFLFIFLYFLSFFFLFFERENKKRAIFSGGEQFLFLNPKLWTGECVWNFEIFVRALGTIFVSRYYVHIIERKNNFWNNFDH